MRGMHMSYIVGLCFAGCLLLQVSAVAILMLAGNNLRLKNVGGAVLSYSSWVVFVLPGFILARFLIEGLDPLAFNSYVYLIGGGTLCVFVSLYLKFE